MVVLSNWQNLLKATLICSPEGCGLYAISKHRISLPIVVQSQLRDQAYHKALMCLQTCSHIEILADTVWDLLLLLFSLLLLSVFTFLNVVICDNLNHKTYFHTFHFHYLSMFSNCHKLE